MLSLSKHAPSAALLALLAVLVLAGTPPPARAQTAPALRVATTPIDIGAQVLWAKDEGFLKKAGVDADISLINNGAAIAAAVASGAVDIGQANLVSLATAHEKGLPFVLIAPGGYYTSSEPTTALVVAKSSPVKSAKDLVGKTIAVSGIKNITQVGASAWLDQNGADPNTVHWIELPFPQMAPALAAGRVDAAVIAEPELSEALGHDARLLAPVYSSVAKEFLIGAWFARADWVKAHPDAVKRFAAAIVETSRWANTHHAESAKILEKYTKQAISPNIHRVRWAERLDAASAQPLIDASAKYKVLKAAFPAAEFIAQ
ncbi:MAG TPA: ABC transporter substrate-binding protein [Candidatus Elarobacter sp.]|jgi:NitT/TauT family transport system substrate-binding protein|nr:ABC transporter substrate-binding protein [Candidatus Elarobacter sp.]